MLLKTINETYNSADNIIYCDPVSVATPCGAVDVPFYQSFITNRTENLPCWYLWNCSVREEYGLDISDISYTASPAILGDLSQMQVRFKVEGNPNWNPYLKIGIGDANSNNVTWIDSLQLSSPAVNEYVVSLNGYTGSENHLAFLAAGPIGAYVRMRELTIEADTTALGILPMSNGTIGEKALVLYPNPTSGLLHIDTEGLLAVEVYDMVGRQVATFESSNRSIDMSALSPGSFTLRIRTRHDVHVRHVLLVN